MLISLHIKNYAIIDNINIDFSQGLNVITGETGAGKSIIVGALSLALGYRSSSDLIRNGKDKILVQALFSFEPNNLSLIKLLNDYGISFEDDTLLLTREIQVNGRNLCRVNGTMVNVSTLNELSSFLIDIHGQHEHQRLLRKETHIDYIDMYGSDTIKTQKEIVSKRFFEMQTLQRKYKQLQTYETDLKQKEDYYRLVIKEIRDLDLQIDEDEDLEQRIKILSNSEKLYEHVSNTYESLYNSEPNSIDLLNKTIHHFEKIVSIDPGMNDWFQQLKEASIVVEECTYSLRDYKDQIEFDPIELDQLQSRLNKINQLKRKYGETIAEILGEADECEEKLDLIDNGHTKLEEIQKQLTAATTQYLEDAYTLTKLRKESAELLSERMISLLSDLGMQNAVFDVVFENKESYASTGIDQAEFYITTNVGQEAKPLTKIASGGEISRVMLAIKSIMADLDEINTLIFDEIDTGISGRTAQIVAEKLTDLSRSHQIMCITHLAQIASMADEHFLVTKRATHDETYTVFQPLQQNERIQELARMLGGVHVTEKTLEHAKEMLALSNEYKS